jgi:hypothetical protein
MYGSIVFMIIVIVCPGADKTSFDVFLQVTKNKEKKNRCSFPILTQKETGKDSL